MNGTGTDSPNENKRTARINSEAIFRLFINFDIVNKVLSIINMCKILEIWLKLCKKDAGNLVIIVYKKNTSNLAEIYNKRYW